MQDTLAMYTIYPAGLTDYCNGKEARAAWCHDQNVYIHDTKLRDELDLDPD